MLPKVMRYCSRLPKHIRKFLHRPRTRIPKFFNNAPQSMALILVCEEVSIELQPDGGVDESWRARGMADADPAELEQQPPHLVLNLSPSGTACWLGAFNGVSTVVCKAVLWRMNELTEDGGFLPSRLPWQ